jgi:hypothetical protein
VVGMTFQTQTFRLIPKIWTRGDHLYARTSYPVQAMTLFACARRVHVDRERRIVEIEDVRWWISRRSVVIPFERVAYIDSKYGDLGTSWGWAGHGCWARTDKWERFTVGLVLRAPAEEIRLFSFTTGGTTQSSILAEGGTGNTHGEQGDHVRFFLEKLQEFLQVPVGSESGPIPDSKTGVQYECSVCKRPSIASRDTCWMCGGPVQAVLPTFDDVTPPKPETNEADGALLDLDITPLINSQLEETADVHG